MRFGITAPGALEDPVCTGLPDRIRADLAQAVHALLGAVYNAATQAGDAETARDALMGLVPSCETAAAAWRLATPYIHDADVAAARRTVEVLASQTRQLSAERRRPSAAVIIGATSMLALAGALLIIPTRMRG